MVLLVINEGTLAVVVPLGLRRVRDSGGEKAHSKPFQNGQHSEDVAAAKATMCEALGLS